MPTAPASRWGCGTRRNRILWALIGVCAAAALILFSLAGGYVLCNEKNKSGNFQDPSTQILELLLPRPNHPNRPNRRNRRNCRRGGHSRKQGRGSCGGRWW
ncbi:hypothetical protein HYH03_018581 [Edaphochlamys debaryana]|uniref:Uncharacterized protein n=1 Tax=Edaphochlamys debaryana TaxID=47281 RepID=A0A835XFK7_9CHLO|nr:hypothetical protein HYH03_018581 [Edaphochlamys debaryana]|eukprot:KAG2482474.1 hypothetical protein HYH03_018581 [Edaphochlamys debaryana]